MVRIDLTKTGNNLPNNIQASKAVASKVLPLQERDRNAGIKGPKQTSTLAHSSSSSSTKESTSSMAEPPNDTWFCYLMKQLGGHCKNEANIKVAREPYADVDSHNRGDVNDKATKPAKGLWQVEMIIGPFPTEREAAHFRMEWMLASRGMSSRRDCGIIMTNKKRQEPGYENLYCFDKRLVPYPLNTYLICHGMDFLCVSEEAFNKLVSAVHSACQYTIETPFDLSPTTYAFDYTPKTSRMRSV